ncbi:MAG: PAS domain-containing sensor histidine kinase [Phototrophicaceae bacterium]
MSQWHILWHKLTSPSKQLTDERQREQATLFAATLFVMASGVIILTLTIILSGAVSSSFYAGLILNSAIYMVLYALSRTTFANWSMRLAIWFASASLFYTMLVTASQPLPFLFNFLSIPILLSGFFLRTREAIINLIIIIGLVIATEVTNKALAVNFFEAPLLLLEIGTLSIIGARINRQYQQRALDNEMRYRSLMEANYEGVVLVNAEDNRIIDANAAIKRILGYEYDDVLNYYPVNFVAEHERSILNHKLRDLPQNIPFEVMLKHKLGYEIHAEVRMRQYQFRKKPAYVFTILDITDRKQAESLIVESEERFRAVFNTSMHYIGVLDPTGRILELNAPSYETFGYTPSEVLGAYLWEKDLWAHSERAKDRIRAVIQDAISGISHRYELKVRDKNNDSLYLDFSIKPIKNTQDVVQMIVIEALDMTNYYQVDKQRREMNNRYIALFKNTTDAVFIVNMQGDIIDANERASDTLHATYEQITTSHIRDFVAEEQRDETKIALTSLQQGSVISDAHERMMKRADGTTFEAETIGIVIDSEGDNEPYILSTVRDISERKRLEQERFTTQLNEERTQLLAHFIENASHHFRTPITNMKTRMYLLPRVLEKPKKRDENIKILNQELERLQNILNDLLTILRLQKDDTEYSLSYMTVNQIISEVRQHFEGRDTYSTFQWQWMFNADNPTVFGDRARLAYAIFNLVDNAMTYTPENGTITINSFTVGDFVTINVIDTGAGIAESDSPHIFKDFYRGQDAMTEDSTSSGLGLTIAKLTVERHRGKIFVDSALNRGSHFQVVLPTHVDWSAPPLAAPYAMLASETNTEEG